MWAAIRYPLAVLALAVAVVAVLLAMAPVHFGPPPPYNPPQDPALEMDLHFDDANATILGGTITSHAFQDCPNVVLIVNSGRAYVAIGRVAAGQKVTFSAAALNWSGRPYSMRPLWNINPVCEPSRAAL